MTIQDLAKEKILILDGAMGTMIQQYAFDESHFRGEQFINHPSPLEGNNDLLSITQAEAIRSIHLKYLMAGADIIETNTFSSNRISMADYGLDQSEFVYQLNVEAVKRAKEAIQLYHSQYETRECFVAGSIGPTNKTASISPKVEDPAYREVDYDFLASIYFEQTSALLEAGADLLLVETIFDTLNAKAAFYGIQEAMRKLNTHVPLMASGTITDKSGRTLSGQTTEAFYISLSHVPLFSIGLNCALGARDLKPYLKVLSDLCPCLISAYPNAGLPNSFGLYDEDPDDMASQIEEYLKDGIINVLGGCCGTTPDHISAMNECAKKYKPRKVSENG